MENDSGKINTIKQHPKEPEYLCSVRQNKDLKTKRIVTWDKKCYAALLKGTILWKL